MSIKKWIACALIGLEMVAHATPKSRFNGDVVITGSTTGRDLILSAGATAATLNVTGDSTLTTASISQSALIGSSGSADSKSVLELSSTTKGFLPPRMSTGQRDSIVSPTTGLTIFNNTTNKLNLYNGSQWGEVAGSGTGLNNYITNGTGEEGTTGWATYADTAKNIPADGTGGSPNSTFTRNTSSPMRGTADFLWTKSGSANRQGEGVSYAFSIDAGDRARPLSVSFDYRIGSGTFVAADGITAPLNDNTTSTNAGNSDLEVFLYDVTNAALIPVTPQVLVCTSSTSCQFKGRFQTASNSTSYRLIFHTATTSTSNYTVNFDNVFVGAEASNYGAPVTDWVSYTPIFTGFGTPTSVEFQYRRVGDSVEIQGKFASGSSTGVEARVTLPSGLTSADTAKIPSIIQVGAGVQDQNLAGVISILAEPSVTYHTFGAQTGSTTGLTKQTASNILSSGQKVSYFARIPIQGWSSTVQMSNDTDTRVVAARAAGTATGGTANNVIVFPVSNFDTHGSYSTSTGRYTVPVSGYYRFCYKLNASAGTGISLYKNGVQDSIIGILLPTATGLSPNLSGQGSGCGLAQAVAGDLLDIRPGNDLSAGWGGNNFLFIDRLSGPASIAATDRVAAYYSTTAGGAYTSSDPINFVTKSYDLTNSVTTGSAWKFTAPVSGVYTIKTSIQTTSAFDARVFKNGSLYNFIIVSNDASFVGTGSTDVQLLAGDYIDLRFGASETLGTTVGLNWVAILLNN